MKRLLTGLFVMVVVGGNVVAQAQSRAVASDRQTLPPSNVSERGPSRDNEMSLGTVRLREPVLANGRPLAAGTYDVRLTATEVKPAVGETPGLERWGEFLQNGEVKGREVVTIIPATEIKQVAKEAPPQPGTYRVDVLKENKYVRIWINRRGDHYLFNLPPA